MFSFCTVSLARESAKCDFPDLKLFYDRKNDLDDDCN